MRAAPMPMGMAVLAAAGLATGAAGAAAQDPAPPPVQRATVTLDASARVLRLGTGRPPALTLGGTLASPAAVSGVQVRLVGHAPAYDRDTVVRTVRTDRA